MPTAYEESLMRQRNEGDYNAQGGAGAGTGAPVSYLTAEQRERLDQVLRERRAGVTTTTTRSSSGSRVVRRTSTSAPAAAAEPEPEPIERVSILSSPTVRYLKDPDTGLYYLEYTLPGGGSTVLFELEPEQIEPIFGEAPGAGWRSIDFDAYVRRDNVHFGGNVAEIEGEGSWEEEVNRVITLALDQGNLPQWIRDDPKALDALWVMTTEDRTEDWFYEQISGLRSFKERYPGVASLESRGMTIAEAVRAHTEFEHQLKTLHAAAGFDSAGVTPEIVGNLIQRGYSAKQVAESYSTWKRMQDHAPALEAFNQVLVASGRQPLTATEMYAFLQGTAPIELYNIYEASAITEAAEATGLIDLFDANDALSLALETDEDITRNQAFEVLSGVAAQALRFRHQLNINEYGLDIDDLIDVSFGRAPRSGKTSAEVGEILARISQQAEGFLRQDVTPFYGFSPTGRPQARSFGELRRASF